MFYFHFVVVLVLSFFSFSLSESLEWVNKSMESWRCICCDDIYIYFAAISDFLFYFNSYKIIGIYFLVLS